MICGLQHLRPRRPDPIDTVLAAVEAARQGLVLAKTEADAATLRAYIDDHLSVEIDSHTTEPGAQFSREYKRRYVVIDESGGHDIPIFEALIAQIDAALAATSSGGNTVNLHAIEPDLRGDRVGVPAASGLQPPPPELGSLISFLVREAFTGINTLNPDANHRRYLECKLCGGTDELRENAKPSIDAVQHRDACSLAACLSALRSIAAKADAEP